MPQNGGQAASLKERDTEMYLQCPRQLRYEAFVSGGTEFSGRIVTLFCGYPGVKTFLSPQTPAVFANDALFVVVGTCQEPA